MEELCHCDMTATELIEKIRNDELKLEEVASAYIKRIEEDKQVHAHAYFDPEPIIEQARDLDAKVKHERGPFHGVFISIKDVFHVKGMPTQYNLPDSVVDMLDLSEKQENDAPLIGLFRENGAIILGKATTTQYAASSIGPKTRNPLDMSGSPGGSSTSSAAAVASFQAQISLGTQTGGSTIRPASYCDVFGWVVSHARLPAGGQLPFAQSFDTQGLFARDPQDLILCADVLSPETRDHSAILNIQGSTFALWEPPGWNEYATKGTRAAMTYVRQLLSKAGAKVEKLSLPERFDALPGLYYKMQRVEAYYNFKSIYDERLDADIRSLCDTDLYKENKGGYQDAKEAIASLRTYMDDCLMGYAALIAPSATGEAPVGNFTGKYELNLPLTALHGPILNFPATKGENGMPIGISLYGARGTDKSILNVGVEIAKLISQDEPSQIPS